MIPGQILFKVTVVAVLLANIAMAQAQPRWNTTFFGDVAIEGYDPVAYFSLGRAVQGDRQFSYRWQGANWRFANAAHRQMFIDDPARYAPQYGGFCAYAVAQDSTAGIDPDQFTIVNGKLYLNYNRKINQRWLDNRDAFIEQADRNWPGLSD